MEQGMACCHKAAHTDRPLQAPSSSVQNAPPHRFRWEMLIAVVPIVLAMTAAGVFFRRQGANGSPASVSATGAIVGTAVGADEVADNGAGNVTASAKYERAKSTAEQIVFTVALNTHSVDLSSFNPAQDILLRASSSEGGKGTLVEDPSGQSSHHRSFQLSFPRPKGDQVTIIVRNVAGVAQRELPFTL